MDAVLVGGLEEDGLHVLRCQEGIRPERVDERPFPFRTDQHHRGGGARSVRPSDPDRIRSLALDLAQHEVASSRMNEVGYGESQPVADNSTVEGKQANRRVEVAIMANDKLKKAAEEKVQG